MWYNIIYSNWVRDRLKEDAYMSEVLEKTLEKTNSQYAKDGLKRIAIKVILQAIRDCQRGDIEAKSFLKSDKLEYWCDLAEISTRTVRQRALNR